MARNYLVFVIGLVILFAFTFIFCYNAIYAQVLLSGILAVIGFLAVIIMSIAVGLSAQEEGGTLWIYFFVLSGIAAVVFVWFLTRAGTLLLIW